MFVLVEVSVLLGSELFTDLKQEVESGPAVQIDKKHKFAHMHIQRHTHTEVR